MYIQRIHAVVTPFKALLSGANIFLPQVIDFSILAAGKKRPLELVLEESLRLDVLQRNAQSFKTVLNNRQGRVYVPLLTANR